jgi:hypothetical protein
MIEKVFLNFKENYIYLWNIFKYNENNPHEGLDIFEKLIVNFHGMMTRSLNDYMLKNISFREEAIGFSLNIAVWISALRFFIISIIDETYIKIFFADFTYLLPKSNLLSLFFGILFSQTAIGGKYYFYTLIGLIYILLKILVKKGTQIN